MRSGPPMKAAEALFFVFLGVFLASGIFLVIVMVAAPPAMSQPLRLQMYPKERPATGHPQRYEVLEAPTTFQYSERQEGSLQNLQAQAQLRHQLVEPFVQAKADAKFNETYLVRNQQKVVNGVAIYSGDPLFDPESPVQRP